MLMKILWYFRINNYDIVNIPDVGAKWDSTMAATESVAVVMPLQEAEDSTNERLRKEG